MLAPTAMPLSRTAMSIELAFTYSYSRTEAGGRRKVMHDLVKRIDDPELRYVFAKIEAYPESSMSVAA